MRKIIVVAYAFFCINVTCAMQQNVRADNSGAQLVLSACDAVKKGKLHEFLQPLMNEYSNEVQIRPDRRSGKLLNLLSAAEQAEARYLSALCFVSLLPQDIVATISAYGLEICEWPESRSDIEDYIISSGVKKKESMDVENYMHYGDSLYGVKIKPLYGRSPSGSKFIEALAGKVKKSGVVGIDMGRQVWDLSTMREVFLVDNPFDGSVVALNSDGSVLAVRYKYWVGCGICVVDKLCMHIYDVKNEQVMHALFLENDDYKDVRKLIFKDDRFLVCCTPNMTYELDLNLGKSVFSQLNHADLVVLHDLFEKISTQQLPKQLTLKIGTVAHAMYQTLPENLRQYIASYIQKKIGKMVHDTCRLF